MKKLLLPLLPLAFICLWLNAQTSVKPMTSPKMQFFGTVSSVGQPLAGGCVWTYAAGTTNPLASYTDATGTVQNANPVILDSAGSANIWLGPSVYKIAVYSSGGTNCATGTLQLTVDNFPGNVFSSSGAVFPGSSSGTTTVKASATASGTLTLPAATDTLVGKATTDTLTNKTLTGASSGNSVNLLTAIDSSTAITGTGAAANLFSWSLPANSMQAGKGLQIAVAATHGTGSASVSYAFNFGSCNIPIGSGTGNAEAWIITLRNKAGVTNAQTYSVLGAISSVPAAAGGTCAIDTTTSQTLTVTFNVANTDTVMPQQMVETQIQ